MKTLISILFLIVILLLGAIEVEAQQLREIVKQVDESVVVVKTVEKNLLTSPQTMFVSSPGSGSGVLISSGFASKVGRQRGMRSVPPRGSGWVGDRHANSRGFRRHRLNPPATAWWY